jgi:hypothetical protein
MMGLFQFFGVGFVQHDVHAVIAMFVNEDLKRLRCKANFSIA